MQKLMCWYWPGNVRELENLIERSMILSAGNVLALAQPQEINGAINAAIAGDYEERMRIMNTLCETRGRVGGPNGAAFRLGIKRSNLQGRMKKLGIDARAFKTGFLYNTQAA